MIRNETDDLAAAVIKSKPQFKFAIERMHKATKALNDRNVDAAFRKYLEKIARSNDAEAALFVAEMDKYSHATQDALKTLGSAGADRKEAFYIRFPQAQRIVAGALFALACLAGLIFYLVAGRK